MLHKHDYEQLYIILQYMSNGQLILHLKLLVLIILTSAGQLRPTTGIPYTCRILAVSGVSPLAWLQPTSETSDVTEELMSANKSLLPWKHEDVIENF